MYGSCQPASIPRLFSAWARWEFMCGAEAPDMSSMLVKSLKFMMEVAWMVLMAD